jgi:SAM-dependent methyltransferase
VPGAEFWDERYGEPGYAYGTEPNDFLVEVQSRLPRGRVLCLGAGEGRNAVHLAERGYDVTAVDFSAVAVDKTERLAAERGVRLEAHRADLADYPIAPGAWSGIVSIFCHLPPALRVQVHAAVVAGLAPGGAFVLETYTPRQLELGTGGPPVRELLVEPAELERELTGLELEILREIERDVREGRYHGGRSAVVQLLGLRPSP